jgi:hypothetical protein
MRTPTRLALTIFQASIAQLRGAEQKYPPVHCLRIPDDRGETMLSAAQGPALLGEPAWPRSRSPRLGAPVLWLTGDADPLEHPGIGRLTRELQDRRRFVFLETDGQRLRRRLHEFCPDSRLYLTVRLYGTAAAHDVRLKKPGAFALAAEGIRAAQLSGYLVCVHVVIDSETKLANIQALLQEVGAFDVDGVVVTASSSGDAEPVAVRQLVSAARSLLGSPWWVSLSRELERALGVAPRKMPFATELRTATDEAIAQ